MYTKKGEQTSEIRKAMRGGDGEAVMTKLSENLPGQMRVFSTITLNPGCSIGFHVHEKETELFYFVSGTGRAMDDDRELLLGAGDALTTRAGHGHSVACAGDEPLVLVAVIVKEDA